MGLSGLVLKLKPVLMNEGGKSSNHEEIDKRPVLQKLLLGIEEGTIRHLYAYNIDRLSRNDIVQFQIRTQMSKNEVLFYSGSDTSPIDLNNPHATVCRPYPSAFMCGKRGANAKSERCAGTYRHLRGAGE